eukprot:CAMPEP_0197619314 /NCGR_PEP_ID=MMETSP1338-20131121/355_1 /TAXON_ID=43686 ORGANISM="Pelagodinium beii, Strain RCC1491" /NCGR_SAMPLE_ID=MMETSP1338 /ASSEMBLY_ACC=CAM_ASM_000754 /LENGTH=199 /DNA_ID=CAMNT_0043188257 /DNA_START=66 /DNA_END=665 /DNA_ORIENTATION=+
MAKASKMLIAAAAVVALCKLPAAFVPAPANRSMVMGTAAGAAMLGAAPAYADRIDDAAVKLSEQSYEFLKKIDWNEGTWAKLPGASPPQVLDALKPVLSMGVAMNPILLNRGMNAHIKAFGSVDDKGVTSLEDYTAINAAIGHMVASVPAWKTLDVYGAFSTIFPAEAQKYLMGKYGGDAETAYNAFLEFKDVVKSTQR